MNLSILKNIGLLDGEVKIYNTLLEQGELSAGAIIKASGLKRGDCYNKIYALRKKGLIEEFTKNKKKYFRLEHPNKIEEYINTRVQSIEDSKKELDLFLPSIIDKFSFISNKPGIRYFEGIDGIKEAYLDTLDENAKKTGIKAIISPADPHPNLYKWLTKFYVQKRIKAGIGAKLIACQSRDAFTFQKLDNKQLRQTVLVPRDKYPFKMEIDIYGGNKVAFISFAKDELVAFIIQSKAVYQTVSSFFDLNWENLKNK